MKQLKANGVCSHDVYKPSWWLFEEMSFLDPYIAQRKGESSLTISKTQSKDTESVKMYDEDNDDLEFLDNKNNRQAKENVCRNIQPNASCSSPTRPRSATPSNRKKVNCFVDSLDELLTCDIEDYWKNAINVVKSMGMTEEMEDELKHWILYIEGKLRNNPHLNNLAAVQRKIIQLFHFNNFLIFINNACPYKQFIYLLNI
ncbi:PREDICTED: uncharacterized protein LOC108776024 [Cyphomyrmex costatus]|nr:PREDICTED: uncharacterized protein LOC108776024 [Cyphomyrmex costatus]